MAKKKKLNLKLKEGAYHKQKGIPMDETMPMAMIEQDLHSLNPKTRKRAQFAKVSKTWAKRGKKGK